MKKVALIVLSLIALSACEVERKPEIVKGRVVARQRIVATFDGAYFQVSIKTASGSIRGIQTRELLPLGETVCFKNWGSGYFNPTIDCAGVK